MAKEIADNPAWRLYDLIERALQSPNGTAADFWAAAFAVKRADTVQIFRGLVLVSQMIDETERLLREADVDHTYFLAKITNLRKALAVENLEMAAASIVNLLAPVHREIGYWAHQIGATNFALRLSNEQLSDLTQELDSVYESVRSAALDEDLKRVLLDALEGLRRAINEYRLRGSAGLRDEIEHIVARMARHADNLRPYSDESWFTKLFQFLTKADSAAQAGQKYLPLLKRTADLLLTGSTLAE